MLLYNTLYKPRYEYVYVTCDEYIIRPIGLDKRLEIRAKKLTMRKADNFTLFSVSGVSLTFWVLKKSGDFHSC